MKKTNTGHAQGQPLLPISINVSKASFEDGHYYLGEILDICKRYGVDPSLLELELHEDIPFEHKEQVQMFVQRLKGAGLRCSLDDFGSSRCNLHVLSWIDVDMVKLDHSFFAGPWNSRQQILLQHIIPMLHRLHIPILAEGVETQEQVQFLTDLHCTLIHKLYHPRFSKQQHKLFCMLDSHGHDTAVQRLLLCMACICFFHSDTSAVKCCRFFFFYVCFLCVLLGICRSLRYLVTVLRDTLISIVLSLMTSC
jgi:predicted signal transduction protein with EAL and GGDEF domain